MPKFFAALLLTVCLSAGPLVAMAQQVPTDPYLAGVAAYNSGDHEEAVTLLSTAIEEEPQDPRAYYFRGLAKLGLGERVEGTDDLRQAATLELAGGWTYASIDRALATVQGWARTTLEQVRREVRLAAERTARTEPARQRRAAWEAEEKKVLRTRTELPIEALVNQLTPDQALAAASKSQGAVEEFVASAEEAAPAVAESSGEMNPFADEPNPFAEEPAAETPEAEAGPVVVTQPDDSPFTDDPFLQPGPPQPEANPPVAGAPGAPSAPDAAGGFARGLGSFLGKGGIWKILGDAAGGKTPSIPGAGGAPPGGGFGPPEGGGGFGPPDGFPEAEGEVTPEDPDGGFAPPAEDESPFDDAPDGADPGMTEEEPSDAEPSPFDSAEPAQPEGEEPEMIEPETEEASPFDAAGPEAEGGDEASPFGAPN